MDKEHALVQTLLGKLFHSTSIKAYRKIREDGYIRPNIGNFPYTHGQSEYSCVTQLKAISLFDFGIPVEDIFFMENPLPWETVIIAHEPITVLMSLDRQRLDEKLISWAEIQRRTDDSPCMLIPYVEAGYPEAIPLDAVEGHVIVYALEPTIFEIVDEQVLTDEYLDHIARITSG